MAFDLANFTSSEYAWKDITAVMAGRPVMGITEISWSTKRTTKEVFGKGSDAHTITTGNKSKSGSFTLLQSEYEALIEAVQQKTGKPDADLTDAVFDLTIAFAVSPTARIKTVTIIGVHPEEDTFQTKQDDPNFAIVVPYKCLKIIRNS